MYPTQLTYHQHLTFDLDHGQTSTGSSLYLNLIGRWPPGLVPAVYADTDCPPSNTPSTISSQSSKIKIMSLQHSKPKKTLTSFSSNLCSSFSASNSFRFLSLRGKRLTCSPAPNPNWSRNASFSSLNRFNWSDRRLT